MLFSEISTLCQGHIVQEAPDQEIAYLVIDSRKALHSEKSLFFAIVGDRHNGHDYIRFLYEGGFRYFIVEQEINGSAYPEAGFIKVPTSVGALQTIAAYHRNSFSIPVVGITGSNGKTIVKEWLYQLLSPTYRCIKSPGSYNSQVGVPLSVWPMNESHQMAIFEAGISERNEMQPLQNILRPTVGIFTNLGDAHDENFASKKEKAEEKIVLFNESDAIIYCHDHPLVRSVMSEWNGPKDAVLSWGQREGSTIRIHHETPHRVTFSGRFGEFSLTLPFSDIALKENTLHCIVALLYLGHSPSDIDRKINTLLRAIPMRLSLKRGLNRCQLIDDTYNNDLEGLQIGLDFMSGVYGNSRTVILSDMTQSGLSPEDSSQRITKWITQKKVDRLIGIGPTFYAHQKLFSMPEVNTFFYPSTDHFIGEIGRWQFGNEVILIKGARSFQFEKIVSLLQEKVHGSIMEVNLDAIVHNLNFFKSLLRPKVKLIVMVKAFAYGSGMDEIAGLLQYHQVDYLGVAHADEGVSLRRIHITTPIIVMNPTEETFDLLLAHDLEPEIYSLPFLRSLTRYLKNQKCKIHIKIDTGMHRLGFQPEDIPEMIAILKLYPNLEVVSVFSHLAASEMSEHDTFSKRQADTLIASVDTLMESLRMNPLRHILNSGGILRFPDLQWDMVRLGIGLYGVDPTGTMQHKLEPVVTLKTTVLQVKQIAPGETVGYGRNGEVKEVTRMAVIAIGYADGFSRAYGNGKGEVLLRNRRVPIVGNVCMDMTMIDVTGVDDVKEGDEVVIFGEHLPIREVAKNIGTIPYEVLTSTGERVKRVFYAGNI